MSFLGPSASFTWDAKERVSGPFHTEVHARWWLSAMFSSSAAMQGRSHRNTKGWLSAAIINFVTQPVTRHPMQNAREQSLACQ